MSYEKMKTGRRPRLSRRSRANMDRRIEQAQRICELHEEPAQDYAATDLICNLLHLCRELHGMSPDDAIRMARMHYDAEVAGED